MEIKEDSASIICKENEEMKIQLSRYRNAVDYLRNKIDGYDVIFGIAEDIIDGNIEGG